MANYENIYTGKGLATTLPQGDSNAMARLGSFIAQAEELKYNTFKQNEQEFLKNSNIDPVFFISTANQQTQANLLDEYNKKWSDRMRQTNNNLSTADKQTMLAEKNYLIAQQQKMAADQDLWMQHRDLVMKNPNRYDAEEWAIYDKAYRETGEYPITTPPIKARSIDMALEENPVTGAEIRGTTEETRGGIKGFVDYVYSADEASARQRVKNMILSDESYTKDVSQQFASLDEQTKMQYLDADKNGIISPQERKDFNPIIKWAQDTKWRKARKEETASWRANPRISTTAKSGVPVFVGGKQISMPIGKKRTTPVNYGGEIRSNLYSFGGTINLSDFPTENARVIWDTSIDQALKGGYSLSGRLLDYDKDNDKIIIRTTTGNNVVGVESGQLVEIDATKVPDVNSFPIEYNGKLTILGELRGNNEAQTTTVQPTNNWEKYKR